MSASIKSAFLALALAGASLALAAPAKADSLTIAVNPPIAFGFNDGYWDQSHHWHAWRDHAEAERWRAEHRDHFYAYNHDRDHDQGWRDHDQWWAHHH